MRHQQGQRPWASLENHLRDRLAPMGELLGRLVDINSFWGHGAGVNRVGDILAQRFRALGWRVEAMARPRGGDDLVALNPGAQAGARPLLLSGHMDTVFPPDSPFQTMRQEGDRLLGPGVADMKGGLVVMLGALEALAALGLAPDLPLVALLNGNEEDGRPQTQALLRQWGGRSQLALVFEMAGPQGQVVTGRRAKRSFELITRGRAGHAAFSGERKPSAILELAHQTIALEALHRPEDGVSVNVGLVRGGMTMNSVAEEARAWVDTRHQDPAAGARLLAAMEAAVARVTVPGTSAELVMTSDWPLLARTPGNGALFRAARDLASSVGVALAEELRPGGSDANFIGQDGCPVLDGLGPLGGADHSDREYILTQSLARRAALAAWLIHGLGRQIAGGRDFRQG